MSGSQPAPSGHTFQRQDTQLELRRRLGITVSSIPLPVRASEHLVSPTLFETAVSHGSTPSMLSVHRAAAQLVNAPGSTVRLR